MLLALIAVAGLWGCAAEEEGPSALDEPAPAAAPDDAWHVQEPGVEAESEKPADSAEHTDAVVDSHPVAEGDMVIPRSQITQGIASSSVDVKLWTGSTIHYAFDDDFPNRERAMQAMAHWEANSKIRFAPRDGQADYVQFIRGNGCFSYVGRVGGKQDLSLGDGCFVGQAIHEIGHAVGLFHEQSRSDRDQYVSLHLENVSAADKLNFDVTGFQSLGDYDVGSIMHYGAYFFSKNGKPTLTKKDGSVFAVNRSALSAKDVAGVAQLYAAEPTAAPAPDVTRTTASDVNLRQSPSTSAAVVTVIPKGTSVRLTGQSQAGFVSATYKGMTGWIYGTYLTN
jgi:hypothetical protein